VQFGPADQCLANDADLFIPALRPPPAAMATWAADRFTARLFQIDLGRLAKEIPLGERLKLNLHRPTASNLLIGRMLRRNNSVSPFSGATCSPASRRLLRRAPFQFA